MFQKLRNICHYLMSVRGPRNLYQILYRFVNDDDAFRSEPVVEVRCTTRRVGKRQRMNESSGYPDKHIAMRNITGTAAASSFNHHSILNQYSSGIQCYSHHLETYYAYLLMYKIGSRRPNVNNVMACINDNQLPIAVFE